MTELPILSIIIVIPAFTALFLMLTVNAYGKNSNFNYSRYVALLGTIFTFIASLYLLFTFDATDAKYQFIEKYKIFGIKWLEYSLAMDSISLCFVLLTSFLTLISVAYSVGRIRLHIKNYLLNINI